MFSELQDLSEKVMLPWKLLPPEKDGRIVQYDQRETIIHVPPCNPYNEAALADREIMVLLVNSTPRLLALFQCLSRIKDMDSDLRTVGDLDEVIKLYGELDGK